MPHSGNICQAILIPYEFNLGWKTEQVIIKKGFNVEADGERGVEDLFNWIMAGYIFEIFQSILI